MIGDERKGPHWTGLPVNARDFAGWLPEFWSRLNQLVWSLGNAAMGRTFVVEIKDAVNFTAEFPHGMRGVPSFAMAQSTTALGCEVVSKDAQKIVVFGDLGIHTVLVVP